MSFKRGRFEMREAAAFTLAVILLQAAVSLTAPDLFAAPAALAAATTEEELFRQVKVDVFDQDWPAVLRGCDEILPRYPSGSSGAQAALYGARAMTSLPGREQEGLEAFRRFIANHAGDTMMVEQVWAAIFSAACGPQGVAKPSCLSVLKDGLASDSRYVSTLAAIRVSDTTDEGLRRRALVTLKKAYGTQTDSEIKNEILIAILKI